MMTITADDARKIAESKAKSKVVSDRDSPLFKYAMDQIERSIRDTSIHGGRSFSDNVIALAPGYVRKVVAEELRKNGFSYYETQKSPNCTLFEVSW